MRRYHFDLLNTDSVTDAGGSLLDNDDQAKKIAHDLVKDVRGLRPELVGHGYEVVVRDDAGAEILRKPIDTPDGDG